MPDFTNAELMDFICRVLKKVHAIESKLDQFLGIKSDEDVEKDVEKDIPALQIEIPVPQEKPDLSFNFNPINDDEELQEISNLINNDPEYLQNLRLFMQSKQNLCLEHFFTENFLLGYNLSGLYGKKKLEDLAPYEKVYVYTRKLNGEDPTFIRKFVMNEIHRIKKRVSRRARHRLNMRLRDYENLEEGQIPVDHDYQNFNEDSLSIDEENSQLDIKNEPFDENSDSDEPLIKLVPSTSMACTSDNKPTGFPHEPINTKKELIIVDERIMEDPEYLEELRNHFSSLNRDNVCRLDQLFTDEFLFSYTYLGMSDRDKLTDLMLYQQVYFHLKRIKGATLEDIAYDAKTELRRMKKRVYARHEPRRGNPTPSKRTKLS
ncbi:uncharacterized protein LOC134834595 [Culicoides brevitarsis]|uniref:uncharacterized protein LOC134834595 n=1 Tax=Culicoides brevitarsis TaxID=469753 RepID=UPI00307C39CC